MLFRSPRLQQAALSLEGYVAEAHVQVRLTGLGRGAVDQALAERGLTRHIACSFGQFASAARLVAQNELLCTLPRRVARALAEDAPLSLHELPLPVARAGCALARGAQPHSISEPVLPDDGHRR